MFSEVKELAGHQPTSELFRKTLKEYIAKRKTFKRQVNKNPKSTDITKTDKPRASRFIPKSLKVAVRSRDNNQCSFVSEEGIRCTERHGLEFDHCIPYAAGGSTDFNNLRLLCKAHNLLMAERLFGKEKMQRHALHKRI